LADIGVMPGTVGFSAGLLGAVVGASVINWLGRLAAMALCTQMMDRSRGRRGDGLYGAILHARRRPWGGGGKQRLCDGGGMVCIVISNIQTLSVHVRRDDHMVRS
jgi:hypothetical protein